MMKSLIWSSGGGARCGIWLPMPGSYDIGLFIDKKVVQNLFLFCGYSYYYYYYYSYYY